jgi:F0F1-type ATP synthase assembly protein I
MSKGNGPPDSKELGYYFSLAQVGMEMVAPMGLGIFLDYSFGWTPWGTVIGFVLGFVGGFAHMLMMVQRHDAEQRSQPPRDTRS